MHDLAGENKYLEVLRATRLSATGTATGVDVKNAIGTIKVILSATKVSGTAPTLAVKVQEASDNTNFTDVSSGAFTTLTDASGTEAISVDSRAVKRYLRAHYTIGGSNTPVFDASVLAVFRSQVGGV
jgi:hypothetical protein